MIVNSRKRCWFDRSSSTTATVPRAPSLVVLLLVAAVILLGSNIQMARTVVTTIPIPVMMGQGNVASAFILPAMVEQELASARSEVIGDRSRLQLTTFRHNHTIQTLVLSPNEGVLVGVGTTAFIPCPLPRYKKDSFELRSVTNANTVYSTTLFLNEELQGGPLVMAYFQIDVYTWTQWRNTFTSNVSIIVHDKVLNTQYLLPILVDPNLRHPHNIPSPHFLSATTTIRKQYKTYAGLGKHIHRDAKSNNITTNSLWSDDEVVHRLSHWIQFHRKAGVNHFYLIDNESNSSKPNLPIVGNDITYLRAAHLPYDGWRCNPDLTYPLRDDEKDDSSLSSKKRKKNTHWFTVFGQVILENTILRLAHTEWLMVGDLDEFFVSSDELRFQRYLPNLIQQFQHVSCPNEKPIHCIPLNETKYHNVYCFNFLPHIMNATSNEPLMEVTFRYKPLVRPTFTSTISVHYALPMNASQSTRVTIPPRHGFLAHYSKRGGGTPQNWTWILSTIHEQANTLRER